MIIKDIKQDVDIGDCMVLNPIKQACSEIANLES